MPFGAGMHVCAGRFLARAEILIFIALLFRQFHVELEGSMPGSHWRNAIGVVKPAGKVGIKFTRRAL
jgi:cytochrome P450